MVTREFGPRTWYSLVRVEDGRVAMGGLRSPGEAEAWAVEAGHTLVNGSPAPAPPVTSYERDCVYVVAEMERKAAPPAPRHVRTALTKETAACCLAKRLPDGRPVIGPCGPECERRPGRKA
jgi:hypothetical protein